MAIVVYIIFDVTGKGYLDHWPSVFISWKDTFRFLDFPSFTPLLIFLCGGLRENHAQNIFQVGLNS